MDRFRGFRRIFKRDEAQLPADPSEAEPSTFSGLDTAKTILQATANLGDGALTVPGLKAAAQLAIQIIDIAKVRIFIYLYSIVRWARTPLISSWHYRK